MAFNASKFFKLVNSYSGKRTLIALESVTLIPLLIFSFSSSQNLQESTIFNIEERLTNEVESLKNQLNNQLDTYQNEVFTLMNLGMIQNLIDQRFNDISADLLFNSWSSADQKNGSFYPLYYQNDSKYLDLLHYFEKTLENRQDIDLIRIFYKDGNVLCGASQDGEDIIDYKGDKSWFNDIIIHEMENAGDVYISPISIARQTNTPAIRYITPFDSNGSRSALLIINFKASVITNLIQEFQIGTSGLGMLIDLNYENAEGVSLGPMFISNKLQPNLEFNESSAGKIQFTSSDFTSDNAHLDFSLNNTDIKASFSKLDRDGRTFVIIIGLNMNEIFAPVTNFNNQTFLIISILLFLTLFISFLVTFFLTDPLNQISSAAERIHNGDFTARVKTSTKGEIGLVSKSFNDMTELITEKLIKASNQVDQVANQLSMSVAEMATSANEMSASGEEITSITQQLALGSQDQTKRILESKSQTDHLKSLFSEKMSQIKVASNIIETITSQVNMLALNASIEAARAGEYGRGFSVVADNIRKLADETKKSVTQVTQIINDLEISLQKSIITISKSIEAVSSIAEQTSAGAEQASAATEEQSATMEEFTATAQELSNLAQELKSLTKQLTN